ncbi:hypothetical protein G7054_g13950 [Neopestalotiopsis clavispora]|nr:hypothetical protein G7054_g13950 [Neopestalotiopsis clavispora]
MASLPNHSSSSPRPIYEYQHLPLQSIRLLHLNPGSYLDGLTIRLETVPFKLEEESDTRESQSNIRPEPSQSRGSLIKYEALSYVWGPKEKPLAISIEDEVGSIAHVTQNLYIALKHLRYEDKARVLWIDALCIDQANHEEKSAQVAIMADIYQCAHRVVAWLGPEADDSNRAMMAVQDVGSQILVNWPENNDSSQPEYSISAAPGFDVVDWIHGRALIPFQTPELNAIHHLLSRPWFERLWIRQEILLANRDAMIKCGMHQILWVHFRQAMVVLYRHCNQFENELMLLLNRLYGFIHTQLDSGYRWSRLGFATAICEDPRDRIYGTLRLLYKDRNILGITPDYTKTTGQVYTDATWRMIKQARTLTVLEQCELYAALPGPSWAPDWSRRPMFKTVSEDCRASSCLWTKLPESDGRILRVVGKRVTVIDHSEKFEYADFAPKSVLIHTVRKIVRTILDGTALSSGQILKSCAKMFLGPYNSDSYETPREPQFPALRHLQSAITYILAGCSLEEIEDRLGQEITGPILEAIEMVIAGRQLFIGSNNLFGMTPIFAQPGDHIYVLVGCDIPIALRPFEGNQYLVVGACWADSIMHGEALLGPLPENICPVIQNMKYAFKDIVSGKVALEDPRLMNLGVDLQGFREELEQDPKYRVTLNVDVNILHRAGVTDLQTIELV